MSAADARALLERAAWVAVDRIANCRSGGRCGLCNDAMDELLFQADAYAEVVTAERIAANVDLQAIGGQRLTEAGNEIAKGVKYTRRGPDAQERKR